MTQDMEAAQYHLSRGARKNRTWKTSFALRVGLLVASHCLLASQNTTTGVHSEREKGLVLNASKALLHSAALRDSVKWKEESGQRQLNCNARERKETFSQ